MVVEVIRDGQKERHCEEREEEKTTQKKFFFSFFCSISSSKHRNNNNNDTHTHYSHSTVCFVRFHFTKGKGKKKN